MRSNRYLGDVSENSHRTIKFVLLVILWLCAVNACTTRSASTPEAVPGQASPISTSRATFLSPIGQSPIPTPVSGQSRATAMVSAQLSITQAAALKPETGTALVVGQLIDKETNRPADRVWLYLARVIGPDSNPQVLLDVSVAPLSITNTEGVFYFQDVKPDRYGIIAWSPVSSALLTEPDSEYSLLFSLEAGEVKNLQDLSAFIP